VLKQIKIYFRLFKVATHCLDSFAHLALSQPASPGRLTNSHEGAPTSAEHLCWLLFLHSAVQLILNHLNWVEVGGLWRPGHLILSQIALTQPGGVFWVIVLLKNK
jgi:hypothetical protein